MTPLISVVNSTVHLAGGLDVPTWTLVPRGGEWRLQERGETCVWHRSVRLIRQQRAGDWSEAFAWIGRRLGAMARLQGRQAVRVA